MKLFVDDIRQCPDGWVPARTVTEAIRILDTQDVKRVSLDHDISCDPPDGGHIHASWETFEPVARFIKTMPERPEVYFHTANTEAGRRMAAIIGVPYVVNPAI